MAMRCANRNCSAIRDKEEGKLYRLDLELGNRRGGDEHHIEFLWLCPECAPHLRPKVHVEGDSVQIRLCAHCPATPRIPPQMDRDASMHLHVN